MKIKLKHIIPYICSFFFFTIITNAQNQQLSDQLQIDSLKTINPRSISKKQLVNNNSLVAYLYGSINIDSSLFYSNKALVLSTKIGYKSGQALAHSYIARASLDKGLLKQTFNNYNKALQLFTLEKDSVNMLDCYKGMSYAYSYNASQFKSLNYNLKALKLAEQLKDTLSLSTIYNNIGSIYKRLDNYDAALFYFQKSLKTELRSKIVRDIAISYSNIGVLKVKQHKYKEADEDYKKLHTLLPSINSLYLKSYLYLSFSSYYNGIQKFDSATIYINKATKICETNNFTHVSTRLYRKKGELLLNKKHYQESIYYFNKSLSLSDSLDISEDLHEIYEMRATAYAKLGNYKKAYTSLQKVNSYIDSLKVNKSTIFLTEFEEQQLEKQKLELDLKTQQTENASYRMRHRFVVAIITISLLVFFFAIVLYYFLKVKKDHKILRSQNILINTQKLLLEENIKKLELSEVNLKKLNATKDKFFSIIAHDLKSPFNAILGFNEILASNYKNYSDEKRKKMIDIIGKTSKSTLKLLEDLLSWARSQSDSIKINKECFQLKELVNDAISAYIGAATIKNINVSILISENIKIYADKKTMTTVISNLFSNAIKFSKEDGEILINCTSTINEVKFSIEDNGIGMSKEIIDGLFKVEKDVKRNGTLNEKGTGLGLLLCYEFVEKNNGTIWAESETEKGSKFYVTIPKCKI